MKRSRLWASLLGIVLASASLLALNLALGNTPALGLDLRGGVSVILAPTEGASDDDLIVIRDLIRDELEQRGIAEPDVRVEGSNVVVDLPGVKDQQDALDAVDIAGIVSLRPVLQCAAGSTTSTTVGGGGGPTVLPTTPTTPTSAPPVDSTVTTGADLTPTTVAAPTDTATVATPAGFRRSVPPTDAPTTTAAVPVTTGAAPTTTPPVPGTGAATTTTPPIVDPNDPAAPGAQEILPVRGDTGEICVVGPPGGSGEVFARGSARPSLDEVGRWGVTVDLRGDGETAWNLLASQCFQGSSSCPSRQLAIVLDGVIQSAPQVNAPAFSGSVSITGSFSEGEARSLSRVLNRGAFPVGVEAQSVQTVSPTLGNDSLEAAVVAGIVGAAAILLFMVAYYRKLALVIFGGLVVWGMTTYVAAALVSQWTNYAFTLAGATGVIVAVGVTVDSYVVFFERLKDEVRAGRALRNAAPRSFKATWRTIVSADIVAFLGAAILFWLSVGSVKGFALYLGLTTICDMLVCYFFTRPAVFLLTRSGWFDEGHALGIEARP
ncbi:MAG: protein translocase subunit SecD [Ilumatobacteraceae bacterium]